MSCNNLGIMEGDNVFLENRPDGIRINVDVPESNNNNNTGDKYEGFFKVVKTDSNELRIVDGSYSGDIINDNTLAGYATISDIMFTVDSKKLDTTTGGFVYLQWTYNEETKSINAPTLEYIETYPEYENGKAKIVLATFTTKIIYVEEAETEVIDKIFQQHYGCINSFIIGTCT